MRRSVLLVAVGLISFFAGALEYFPLQRVFVRPGTPAPVILAVGTPEELTTLQFVIVEPPKYGVILGLPPKLFYVPRPGFLGTDWITFLIQKEGRLSDLGTVQLRVIGPEVTFSPAFRFEGNLSFSGPPFAWDAYSFTFELSARFQYLRTQLQAKWSQAGFTEFRAFAEIVLEGTWPISWRLPVTSTLTFNPIALSLTSWTVGAHTTLFGWKLGYYFSYSGADPQTGSYTTFSATGSLERISLASRVKFATLTPTFAEWSLELRGPWICQDCPIKWELEFLQRKLGFGHLSFTMRDIPIPCPACGGLQTFLDVKIKFTPERKTVEPTLRLVSGFVACVQPLVSLIISPPLGIAGIEIYGMEIRCDLPLGYKARFATSFNPVKDAAVTGYSQFFQLIQVGGPVVPWPCCGPGWWQISSYFSRDSGKLFGLAMVDVNVYFPLSRWVMVNVRLQAGLVDPTNPGKTWKISLGWKGSF